MPSSSRKIAFRRRRSSRSGEEGQTLVEFALVLFALLFLLFGIVRFGLLFYNYIDVTQATRDGARRASVLRDDGGATATVKSTIASSTTVVKDADTTVTITPSPPWTAGTDVTVQVAYPYEMDIMGINIYGGPIRAESVVRVE